MTAINNAPPETAGRVRCAGARLPYLTEKHKICLREKQILQKEVITVLRIIRCVNANIEIVIDTIAKLTLLFFAR